ncbi:acetylglutamate kinase [Velocimicrobium porci]|uniref:Acetylglutamate kinase n=1 Tax=Velocimicrobium porci TaxID=2606634 RepID=A0A6L5Y281_9FIRM|nr:acetylglutamate kinase [Velocimicrobium porci]MSS64468.1 acetylglutamate kinase [Velocimicrobium porci]
MSDEMNQILIKAQTLIEALPYIREFYGKTIVVKYGGSAMLDERLEESVIKDVALLKLVGMKPIIVHGGGKEISSWLGKLGKEPKFCEGLRVTDGETIEIAEMVLNLVNKKLVRLLEKVGVKAVGISGKDGSMIKVDKKYVNGKDIGYVGEIKKVDSTVIQTLLESDFIPVIAPLGMDDTYKTYNINADEAASAIAEKMRAEKLVFLTDTDGVYEDRSDKSSVIPMLSIKEAKDLIEIGQINGGMIPKIENCITAIQQGVNRVHILDGRLKNSLLLEIFTKKGIGTVIYDEAEQDYFEQLVS